MVYIMKNVFLTCFLTVFCISGLSGCATQVKNSESVEDYTDEIEQKDSLESFNRAMFSFNLTLDRWFLKPIAKGYDWVTPQFAKRGVRNFFSNLDEINNVVNDVLQWKWKQAANDTGRFLTNSTLGIGGLFDVAQSFGIEKSDGEDFGQTFAKWGMGQGPYLVLPLLGPSSIRDGIALPFDSFMDPVNHINDDPWLYGLTALEIIDLRAQLLETEDLASGDLYVFVRDVYLQRREFLINDGVVEEDSFGDEDW